MTEYCERIKIETDRQQNPKILLGKITHQDETFIHLTTANRTYTINKKTILFQETTQIPYNPNHKTKKRNEEEEQRE